MKPLFLEISGWGPYAGKTRLIFQNFREDCF